MRHRGARVLSFLLAALVIGLCGPASVVAAPPLVAVITPDVSVAGECGPALAADIGLPQPTPERLAIAADLADFFGPTVGPAERRPGGVTHVRQRYPHVRPSRAPPRA